MANAYDVIVIGAGPGGYVAAIRAAQLGLKVAVVEKNHLGGICLNWGCIPTKALLRSAEIYHYLENADAYGVSAKGVSFDPAAVVKRSRGVASQLANGVGFLLKKNKVDVIWGEATVTAPGKLTVKAADNAPKGALGGGDVGQGLLPAPVVGRRSLRGCRSLPGGRCGHLALGGCRNRCGGTEFPESRTHARDWRRVHWI